MADRAIYDGFISYSHAADDLLAPRLQAGLQRFAKPWWKRRAVRIFRDESSLSANPHLWSSITEALDTSGWFVLLLSPDAASSEWVNQEISYWVEHRDPKTILPVVTDGTFGWADDVMTGSAVPEALQGVFTEEPRWVDMRFAKGEEQLDLNNPTFSAAIADIASAIRGVPKDELESEEVRQHRRTVRTAWAAGGLVTILAFAAVGFGIQSARNADEAERLADAEAVARFEAVANAEEAATQAAEAERQRVAAELSRADAERQAILAKARELGAAAVEALEADRDPKLAALLALESLHLGGQLAEQPDTLVDTLFRSVADDRLLRTIDAGVKGLNHIALSPDGTRLASSAEAGSGVVMYSVPDGEIVWEYVEDTSDTFTFPWFRPDGSVLAVMVADSAAYDVKGLSPDDHPNRLLLLDTATGELIRTIDMSPCGAADGWGWSPASEFFVITNGQVPCGRDDNPDGTWVELLDGDSFEPSKLIDSAGGSLGPRVEFTNVGDLYLFGWEDPLEVLRAPDYGDSVVIETVEGYTDVAPDGAHAVTFSPSTPDRLSLVDLETGQRTDILRPLESNPTAPIGVSFSSDSSKVIVQTESEGTLVWDVPTGRQVFDLESGPRGNAAMSEYGQHLYTSHADGTVKIWSLGPITVGQNVVGDLEGYNWVNANSFAISGDIGAAQTITFDGQPASRLVFFDPETGAPTGTSADGIGRPTSLTDGRFLVHEWGEVVVYDAVADERIPVAGCRSLDEDPPYLCDETAEEQIWIDYTVSLDRSQVLLFPDSEPATFELIDSETLETLDSGAWEFEAIDWVMTFTDEWVAGIGPAGSPLLVLDRETGEEITRFVDCGCRPEFSASGKWYANPWDSALVVINLETWELNRYELGLGRIRGVEFSPDDSLLALGDQGEIVLVEVATGEVVRRIPIGDASDFHWIDEQTLLFGNRDGLWATVTLDPVALAQETLANLTRGFTAAECERFGVEPCPSSLDAVRERYAGVGS